MLIRDPQTTLFALSPLVASLGRRAERNGRLLDIARPFLLRLAEASQETVSLTELQGDHGLCVDVVESAQSMRFTLSAGHTFPLHAGCVGKTILAFQSPEFIDALLSQTPLQRYTAHTITAPDALRDDLAKIRKTGVGFSDSEITPGARSVGAPVFDADGQVRIGLVISGPSFRMGDERLPDFFAMVRQAARELSRALGYRDSRETSSREFENAVQP